jgi:hypothetical protein
VEVASKGVSRTGRLWAALLACSLSCAAPELPRTELLVVVDTDLELGSELDALRIEVTGPGDATRSAAAQLDPGSELPQSLGLVHEQGALGPIRVLVLGLLGDQEIVRREAELSFIGDKTLTLPLHLVRACVARDCGEAETCSEHGCIGVEVDATRLGEWQGRLPTLDEPGPDPEDAGAADGGEAADGGLDGGNEEPDASEPDAEQGEEDASTEADAGSSEDGAMCMPRVESCNEADDDCDGVIDNGYDLQSDTRHCGVCNMRCSQPTVICCKGVCARNCSK